MGGSEARALPGQLMAVPPGPRALQHVQVSSSAKIGHQGAERDCLLLVEMSVR